MDCRIVYSGPIGDLVYIFRQCGVGTDDRNREKTARQIVNNGGLDFHLTPEQKEDLQRRGVGVYVLR